MASDDAAANTSTGAPAASCSASVELPAKLNRTAMPGLSCSKAAPSVVKDSVNEAAAETVIAYARELKKNGVDGVFYSTRAAVTPKGRQGYSQQAFEELLRPYDIAILEEKLRKGMDDLKAFLQRPPSFPNQGGKK